MDAYVPMDTAGGNWPVYLSKLHMRLAGNAFDASKDGERLDQAELVDMFRNKNLIRSHYKGRRGFQYEPEPEDEADSHASSPMELEAGTPQKTYTSGIPIFGASNAVDRAGWSYGHTDLRAELQEALQDRGRSQGYSYQFLAKYVSAENSHALAHGDYGTDHLLSAPSASRAQNTEQYAIELGMRAAAEKLNSKYMMDDEHSLVHAKITDVLHPETGRLMARRFKLIRRKDSKDHEGTVVFDHLMDGNRLHISRHEAFALGQKVHDALIDGTQEAPRPDGRTGKRKGMGGVAAPTATELREHQQQVLRELQIARGRKRIRTADSRDREAVNMIGPGFTEASFPEDELLEREHQELSGEDALQEMRLRVISHQIQNSERSDHEGEIEDRFLSSGSVPADEERKHVNAVTNIKAVLKRALGTREPSAGQLASIKMNAYLELMEAYSPIKELGDVNYRNFSRSETKLLAQIEKIRKSYQRN